MNVYISPEPTPFSHKNHSHFYMESSKCYRKMCTQVEGKCLNGNQLSKQAHARKRNTENKAQSFLIEFTSLLLPSLCFRVNEKVLFARKEKLLMFFYQLTSGGGH